MNSKKLYHCTTPKKFERYKKTGHIIRPVRGWSTLTAAINWSLRTNRRIILEFNAKNPHPLSDHRNQYGLAYFADENVYIYSQILRVNKKRSK